jgi:hypothetical protein
MIRFSIKEQRRPFGNKTGQILSPVTPKLRRVVENTCKS